MSDPMLLTGAPLEQPASNGVPAPPITESVPMTELAPPEAAAAAGRKRKSGAPDAAGLKKKPAKKKQKQYADTDSDDDERKFKRSGKAGTCDICLLLPAHRENSCTPNWNSGVGKGSHVPLVARKGNEASAWRYLTGSCRSTTAPMPPSPTP